MEFRGYGSGYCVSCGLLGKRDSQSSVSICYEATAVDRLSGRLTKVRGNPTHPWCFLGKADFLGELAAVGAKEHEDDKMLELIRRDRNCHAWYPWREFLSPKEHWEEQMMLAMEERRKKFEQKMESDRKAFELKLDESNKEERKRTDRVMKWIAVAAIIFALAEVAAGLMGITDDSWVLSLFR